MNLQCKQKNISNLDNVHKPNAKLAISLVYTTALLLNDQHISAMSTKNC